MTEENGQHFLIEGFQLIGIEGVGQNIKSSLGKYYNDNYL